MTSSPVVRLTTTPPSAAEVDVLILPVFESDALEDLSLFDAAIRGEILDSMRRGEFRGKPFDLFSGPRLPVSGLRLLCVGAGARPDWKGDRLRKVATAAGLAGRQRGMGRCAWWHRTSDDQPTGLDVKAVTEGFVLAAYDGDTWKTTPREAAALTEVVMVVPAVETALTEAVEQGWCWETAPTAPATWQTSPETR